MHQFAGERHECAQLQRAQFEEEGVESGWRCSSKWYILHETLPFISLCSVILLKFLFNNAAFTLSMCYNHRGFSKQQGERRNRQEYTRLCARQQLRHLPVVSGDRQSRPHLHPCI